MSTPLPTIGKLRANKSAIQTILHVLAEWNEIEIQQVTKKRLLLARATALWTRISGADGQLSDLWKILLKNFSEELTVRWNHIISLREEYENALRTTLTHLDAHRILDESHLLEALQESVDAEHSARNAYKKSSHVRYDTKISLGNDRSKGPIPGMGKADFIHRQKHSRLNGLRRRFVGEAATAYDGLIEEQHEIVTVLKDTLGSYFAVRSKMACYFARTTSRLVDVTSTFSPFSLAARYHHRLQHDLRLPQYLPTPYIDPRSGMARNRALVGMDLSDEETPQNSLLAVLLDASLGDVGCFKGISKQPCLSEASAELSYLETHWLLDPRQNKILLCRRPLALRHSLIVLYLSCLPSPLLPLSNQQFTQFALKQIKLKTLLQSLSPANMILLGDLCDYLTRMCPHDDRMIKYFGKLILRVDSDLMSDALRERSILGIMNVLVRHLRKVKERTILDIAQSPGWGA